MDIFLKKKWFVINVEITTRELLSKLLLAYKLVNRGHGVILTGNFALNINRFPKCTYLTNSMYRNNHDELMTIKSLGNRLCILDEEAIVIRCKDEYLRRLPSKNMELVDKFFCIGRGHHQTMIEGLPDHSSKFVITGNPRINLLDEMFNEFEDQVVNDIKREYGDFVLLVSNFGTVNLFGSDVSKDQRYKSKYLMFKQQGLLNGPNADQEFYERFEHYENIFAGFRSLVKKIGSDHHDIKIVIRIHPSEDSKIWSAIGKEFSNVHITQEGNLTEWIKASKLVLQNGCTSALESFYLRKPCISYRPVINEQYDQLLPSQLSLNLYSEADVILHLKQNINTFCDENHSMHAGILDREISNSASDMSAEEIVKYLALRTPSAYFSKMVFMLSGFRFVMLRHHLSRLKKFAGKSFIKILRLARLPKTRFVASLHKKVVGVELQELKLKNFSLSQLQRHIRTFDKIYGKTSNIEIQKLSKHSYLLKSK